MTTDMMNFRDLVEKAPDADLLREMIGYAAERLMEMEVGAATGAAYGQKDPARQAQRNGYRDRDWETRAGTVELRIPKHTAEAASTQWRAVADQIRPKVPKLANIMDDAEHDVLAYMTFPEEHRAKLHSTNPIERLNGEIKRRTDVVGFVGKTALHAVFFSSSLPNDDAIIRPVGALLLEQNDEWAVQRGRYMTLETMAPLSDDAIVSLPVVAR